MATPRAAKAKTVDDYIEPFPAPVQERLRKLRALVKSAAPGAVESIGYAIPAYVFEERRFYFAAFKNHIGIYPGVAPLIQFKEELVGYKSAKGSVQFPHDQPLPLALIKRIIKFRLKP
jgi:uncharacterized protein YdhG (YjbR/CyaY superfamily)